MKARFARRSWRGSNPRRPAPEEQDMPALTSRLRGALLVRTQINFENPMVLQSYLLSENYLSVHTFVDERKITLDSFTCDVSENRNIEKIICDYLN